MSHEVETAMFTGLPAWHGIGNVLKEAPDSRTALVQAGLDWQVQARPVFAGLGETPADGIVEVPTRKALMRSIDNRVLGVVSKDYEILQNDAAFEVFDPLVKSGQISYEAAGSLYRGEKIWILAKMNQTIEVTAGDPVESYLLLVNGHDGKTGILNLLTPIRVVCRNTLEMALGSEDDRSGRVIRVAHRGDLKAKVEAAQTVLGFARHRFKNLGMVFKKLLETPLESEKETSYINHLVPLSFEAGERERKRVESDRNKIRELQEVGRGADLPGVRGSVWGLYNAAVEFADYKKSPAVKDRTSFLLVGEGRRFKSRAYTQALSLAGIS